MLTDTQKLICERVINVFETGTVTGKYGAISIFHDGPNRIRQITYGRSQTTEYGNLKELVEMYADAGGTFSAALAPYVERVGLVPLVDDGTFKDLLRRAGNEDAVMRQTQDVFFDRRYFRPAVDWATSHGFTMALSILVIYDSFVHSGGILRFLRAKFTEVPPAAGGDEKTWIKQYVDVRDAWLRNNPNPEVRPSAYRTKDLQREIANGNWDLAALPFIANGTPVDALSPGLIAFAGDPSADVVPFIGALPDTAATEVWSELEPPVALATIAGAGAIAVSAAALAQRILANDRIVLARAHSSGNRDNATAYQNVVDTAAGRPANRSSYSTSSGTGPGGTVNLVPAMLQGLLALAETYSYSVSELCGGVHNNNSRHYAGCTADINTINGQHINAAHPDVRSFRQLCRDLGATEVLGPGDRGHATHVHAGWPRPNLIVEVP